MLVNFGILVAGYYLLGKKPIAAALQSRRDTIAKEIEEAQRMRSEAEARAEKYQAKLAHLEDELKTAREALVRAGEAERERIVREAEAKAERMRKDAEFLVEQELKQIRAGPAGATPVEAAVAAAEELLKKRVTPADQERLAEDYLADLGGKRRRRRPTPRRRARHERLDRRAPLRAGAARAGRRDGHARRARRGDERPSPSAWETSPELRNALENPLVAHDAKKAVMAELATRSAPRRRRATRCSCSSTGAATQALPYVAQYLRELADARKGVAPRRGDDRRAAQRATTRACRRSSRR